ncbi:hypothetical protein EVAR_983_1 [Eumeta japonica]|uniref:Uncharacterized protein n=1 Tax=Eumeta variegata TaxID=151549 RepID=A0A4C1SE56_EUMVA|nr:hypothetical protein EVAR_983_1 [Eumeta japonica]
MVLQAGLSKTSLVILSNNVLELGKYRRYYNSQIQRLKGSQTSTGFDSKEKLGILLEFITLYLNLLIVRGDSIKEFESQGRHVEWRAAPNLAAGARGGRQMGPDQIVQLEGCPI